MPSAHQLLHANQFQGSPLSVQLRPKPSARSNLCARCSTGKNVFDKDWKKGYFGTGYFVEGKQKQAADYSYLKQLEKKQVLSRVEKAKLLSSLEKAGLTLSKIEELKLLSTAESLGALSLLERALETDPGTIASLSIAPIIASILALSVIPDDNPALATAKYAIAAVLFGSAGAFIIGAFLIKSLNDD